MLPMATKSRRLLNPSINSCPYRQLSGGESGHARQAVGPHQTDLRSNEIRRLIRDISIANQLWAASPIDGRAAHARDRYRADYSWPLVFAMASSKIDNR